MKVYIAGKITGNPNFKKDFEQAETELIKRGHAVLNPAKLPDCGFGYEDYMHICFAMIDVVKAVYLLPNWKGSPGANREFDYALASSKIITRDLDFEKDWK